MITGILLAGGRSSRFGANKALCLFLGRRLAAWPAEALREVSSELILSANSSSPEWEFLVRALPGRWRVVMDSAPERGPAEGLRQALAVARGAWVAVAPCDAPGVTPGFYRYLLQRARGRDGAVPRLHGRWEPLTGVYRRLALETALSSQDSVNRALDSMDVAPLGAGEMRKFPEALANVNRFEELEEAQARFKKRGLNDRSLRRSGR